MNITSEDLLDKLEETLVDLQFWVHTIEGSKRDMIEQVTHVLLSDDDRNLMINAKTDLENFIHEQRPKTENQRIRQTSPQPPHSEWADPETTRD